MAVLIHIAHIHAYAIVLDRKREVTIFVPCQADIYTAGLGMAQGIGYGFLHDTVEIDIEAFAQQLQFALQAETEIDLGVLQLPVSHGVLECF